MYFVFILKLANFQPGNPFQWLIEFSFAIANDGDDLKKI